VRAQLVAVDVHDLAGGGSEAVGEEGPGVAVRDEADVVAVGLVGDLEPAPVGLPPDVGLGGVTQREERVRKLLGRAHGQDVRLVLALVHTPPQLAARKLRVVPRAHSVEAEGQRAVEQRLKLDLLVAAQAGVGSTARGVLGHEVLHHVAVEALGQVPDVERDSDHVGGPAGVPRVLQGATATRARSVGLGVGGQGHVHAGDVVTGLGGTGSGHG
jgi:hypothetical protein